MSIGNLPIFLLSPLQKDLICPEGLIDIHFACHLKGGVHSKEGRSTVNDIHSITCQIFSNRSTSSFIDLAQFRHLPGDPMIVEEFPDLGDIFGAGIA